MPVVLRSSTGPLEIMSLRRSSRKRRASVSVSCSVFCTPPSSGKKQRRARRTAPTHSVSLKAPPPVPLLDQLPRPILARLLLFLQVDSLENLASTCSLFDQMINCRFLPSLDFPFHSSFIEELEKTDTLEKKPLLKLRCKKTRNTVCSTTQHDWEEDQSMHWLMLETTTPLSRYIMRSQLSLLSLSYLRELDLVPESFRDTWGVRRLDQAEVELYLNFDIMLLVELHTQDHLSHLTRLGVMQDHHMYLQHRIASLGSLIELNISILTRTNLKKRDFDLYLCGLQALVSKCRAKILNFNVINETRKKIIKAVENRFVEKLTVTGPCSFNLVPTMPNLREVVVQYKERLAGELDLPVCSYWKSSIDDRSIHRTGLCCVDFSLVYASCPKLEIFSSISIPDYIWYRSTSPTKWFQVVKQKFYSEYLREGGDMDIHIWQKKRWFKRKALVPSEKPKDD